MATVVEKAEPARTLMGIVLMRGQRLATETQPKKWTAELTAGVRQMQVRKLSPTKSRKKPTRGWSPNGTEAPTHFCLARLRSDVTAAARPNRTSVRYIIEYLVNIVLVFGEHNNMK